MLVHYHIFKNAGTSLDHALQRSFGSRWRAFEGAHAADVVSQDRLRSYLEHASDVTAVSSHLARPPLPWPECRPIVFVRHPLDRARSVFEFLSIDASQPTGDVARTRGFRGYIEWALANAQGGVVIRDYQTVHLSQATFRNGSVLNAHATADDLREAKSLLGGWGAVGVVDQYERSLQLFQHEYGPQFPDLELAPVWLNATRPTSAPVTERVAAIRAQLGPALTERLEAANALDLELYEFARARLADLCERAGIARATDQ